jgi:hypothetical protein
MWIMASISILQIKENVIFPSIAIGLLLLFQIAKTMGQEEKKEVKGLE